MGDPQTSADANLTDAGVPNGTPPAAADQGGGTEAAGTAQTEKTPTSGAPGDPPNEDIPERKTPRDYFLERQARREAKQKENNADPPDDDDQDDPDMESKIKEVVHKEYGPVFEELREKQASAALEQEINDFLKDPKNKQFEPYTEKIKRYAAHPSRAKVPLSAIAYEVAGEDLMRIGAERAKQADAEAAGTATGGQTPRTVESPDFAKMSLKEFAEYKKNLLRE